MAFAEHSGSEEEMAPRLRAPITLPEDLHCYQHPYGGSQPSVTSVPGGLRPSSEATCTRLACDVHTYMRQRYSYP